MSQRARLTDAELDQVMAALERDEAWVLGHADDMVLSVDTPEGGLNFDVTPRRDREDSVMIVAIRLPYPES